MIMQAVDLLSENPDPTEEEIREGLEGNLCRCTGYQNIVKAVQAAAAGTMVQPTTERRLMTAVDDRPTTRDRQAPAAARRTQRLITGAPSWTDNILLPGMLHLAMVRSPFAHATITAIDTAEAEAAPGVVAVYTGADLADTQGVLLSAWPITPDQ